MVPRLVESLPEKKRNMGDTSSRSGENAKSNPVWLVVVGL
jgi:hypothetical protein